MFKVHSFIMLRMSLHCLLTVSLAVGKSLMSVWVLLLVIYSSSLEVIRVLPMLFDFLKFYYNVSRIGFSSSVLLAFSEIVLSFYYICVTFGEIFLHYSIMF